VVFISRIIILDELVTNQIAAGEVIERPAAVVKELVENSIDAGATQIDIEFWGAGLEQIKVSDNGTGMMEDEVLLALQPHATSKIRNLADLSTLKTLGFRGEALPSIAAVSKFNIFSATEDAIAGTCVQVEGGNIITAQKQGGPKGTIITVRDLFFNTPARLKYLKKPQTEAKHLIETSLRLALCHPEVAFNIKREQRQILVTVGNGKHEDIILPVFGKEVWAELLPIAVTQKSISITGYISRPTLTRANRSLQYFFVNGRYVRSYFLNRILDEAYNRLLPQQRYPVAFLYLTLNPEHIDVNVHPTKLEIRFSHEREISDVIKTAIAQVLRWTALIPGFNNNKGTKQHLSEIEKSFGIKSDLLLLSTGIQETIQPYPHPWQNNYQPKEPVISSIPLQEEKKLASANFPDLTGLGQVYDTYIVAGSDAGLFLIDQHAAHERVVYENLIDWRQKHWSAYQQFLLVPQTMELPQMELAILLENLNIFRELGFEIEEFGGREVLIRSAPAIVSKGTEKDVILALLADLVQELEQNRSFINIEESILVSLACHSAIRSGKKLAREEMATLIAQLAATKQPFTCPHGRPTIIHLPVTELEKRFKRV
jgi:DNA mismatch repair protein MutL